ncbi:MAG: TIGR04133 family radical SAM/SPASM protein [Rikenellaceae bacterium]|nr:TIGR04133 family radical SAM/SPASM protein [Rikenellaceae bacterium]
MANDLNGRRLGLRKRLGLELFAQLYKHTVEEHPLRTLFWECTLRCNLNCRHCGSDCRAEATVPDMPLEDFLRVVDEQITPHVDPHKVMVVISGGEVLVRKDLECAGLELYRRGYPWGIVTNALALTPERFESLLRAGLHSISVSFDGFEEQHNYIRRNPHSYERALAALRMIAADGTVAYDAVTCVTGALVPRLEEMKKLLIANGIKHWRIFTIFPVGRAADDPTLRLTDEQFRKVMEFIRRTRREGRIDLSYACEGFLGGYETEVRDSFYYCSAGVTTASIRVDGALSGCTSIRSNFNQGNIYRDNFWEVWSNRYEPFRNREWARRDKCGDCRMFRYCQGGGMHLRDEEGKLLMCHYKRL